VAPSGYRAATSAFSLVAVDAFAALVALLRFDRQGCDRSRFKALDRDWLTRLFAISVCAILDARERLVDLRDQLALAVARAQFNGPVSLRRGPVSKIGMILVLVLEVLEGFL